jgi:EAL domain-containing protein (putative c-di-GMP-specific phosphodiesterase class I)
MADSRIQVRAGDVIFREGEPPTVAYLIESGEVEITTSRRNERVQLGRLGPGDLLGEMALIDAAPRTATAVALSDCALTAVDKNQIQERLKSADPIIRALLRGQLQRYRSVLARLRGEHTAGERGREGHNTLQRRAMGKFRLENQLREALENRTLEVRLQPIFDMHHERIAGYEALVRWEHPERGPVSPAEFIALAEETQLIVPVGQYVFEDVCQTLAMMRERTGANLPFVAVNVSARQLEQGDLLDTVRAQCTRHEVPASALKIEITESLSLDIERVGALIERCHALGMKVALDDFGTGYSNLGHLHKLRFDTVKLDQGFVRQMLEAPRCLAIVRAIVSMVRALDADLVAEGVEDQAQLDVLRQMGARYAQGWLIGKPQTRTEVLAALAA